MLSIYKERIKILYWNKKYILDYTFKILYWIKKKYWIIHKILQFFFFVGQRHIVQNQIQN
jgi:hypothetical protein